MPKIFSKKNVLCRVTTFGEHYLYELPKLLTREKEREREREREKNVMYKKTCY